ncbi:hypothetical protein MTR_7g053280 [Medicago truncatula]|uniref:Uncharacterized protein n=1 Tax=Medicago truncatula TaxID=3880 RepID=A0A072U9Q0_MEDTR|nr:hypothetical protein MTR_7g053280 [Medicago truncatula]
MTCSVLEESMSMAQSNGKDGEKHLTIFHLLNRLSNCRSSSDAAHDRLSFKLLSL